MKCQFTLSALRNSLLVCLVLGGVASKEACAVEAIEATFFKAEAILKKHPAQLEKFRIFKETTYNQLRNFLSTSNKESYATHVGYIEQNTRDFHALFVMNNEFKCIKNLTAYLHGELARLVTTLQAHVVTRSSSKLCAELMQYQHLLPKVIIDEVGGKLALKGLLEHRLSC